jgi:hypothetical protein
MATASASVAPVMFNATGAGGPITLTTLPAQYQVTDQVTIIDRHRW